MAILQQKFVKHKMAMLSSKLGYNSLLQIESLCGFAVMTRTM